MEEVYQFLKEAGVYYIATVEGDQPRVRPFGTIHIFDGKLYIQTGKKKNVSKQLGINGKTGILKNMEILQFFRIIFVFSDMAHHVKKPSISRQRTFLITVFSSNRAAGSALSCGSAPGRSGRGGPVLRDR